MNKKFNLYLGLTLGFVLTSIFITYYFTSLTANQKKDNGFLTTFWTGPNCGDDSSFKRIRVYKTYYLTSDSSKNELTIKTIRVDLNNLKTSGDSVNGVHVEMTNDMPYKYYLKSIAIFNELPPRLFVPIDNHFYAISKSKFQMTQDSILKDKNFADGIEIIETGGHVTKYK